MVKNTKSDSRKRNPESRDHNEKSIDPEKKEKTTSKTEEKMKCPSHLVEMQRDMYAFFGLLLVPDREFDSQNAFIELLKYIRTHERLLYSTVSHVVYDILDQDGELPETDKFDSLLINIEQLVEYVDDEKNLYVHINAAKTEDEIIFETRKIVWKLWDHVNLAQRQYKELKQSDSEYNEKFEKRIEKIQNRITKEMNVQLLTMVGIFTALAFILFGGISSLENLLTSLRETEILKLLILGCGWGLGILNVVFVFLFCIGKMTKLHFKTSMSPDATFWQRYPVVCWTDFLLCMLMLIFLWLYYCFNRNGRSGLDWLIDLNPTLVSVIGLAVIIVAIAIMFRILIKKTKATVGDEDE